MRTVAVHARKVFSAVARVATSRARTYYSIKAVTCDDAAAVVEEDE